jgi:hypothetical protein
VAEVFGWVFIPPLLFAALLPIEDKTGLTLILPLWVVLYVLLFKRAWRIGILRGAHWLQRALTLNLAVGVFMASWLLILGFLGALFGSPGG